MPTPPGVLGDDAIAQHLPDYREPSKRMAWVVGLHLAVVVIEVLGLVLTLWLVHDLSAYEEADPLTPLQFALFHTIIWVSLISVPIFFASLVLFMTWVYRANKNLWVLEVEGLRFTPGWTVGYFFIPVICLVRPYQAVKEIWQASDPHADITHRRGWQQRPASALVGLWWGFWLIDAIVSYIYYKSTSESMVLYGTAVFFTVGSALLTIALVTLLHARLRRRAALCAQTLAAQAALPPAPPPDTSDTQFPTP